MDCTGRHAALTKFQELISKTDGHSCILSRLGVVCSFVLSGWSLGTEAELDSEDQNVSI